MAELEIDQSHLPRVQEVCQNFAVLEDGVLAHSLQEQEIEHYYTNNIQKNQLVQNDIRVAKKLQDEEQQAQDKALLRQESRQLEEQDFEYARVIQEEIQRCAEEAQRREQDDEELAKQMQEEEEQRIRRTREGSSSGSEPTSPIENCAYNSQHYSPTSSRWRHSTSAYSSQHYNEPPADSPKRVARKNPCLRSSEGQPHLFREECLSVDSDGSNTVFSEHPSVRSKTLPLQYHSHNRNYRSLISHKSFPDWERDQLDEYYYKNSFENTGRTRNPYIERNYSDEGWHSNRDQELAEVRERRCSRTESVLLHNRHRQSFREAAKTCAKDNPDKHVRFRDDAAKSDRSRDESSREVWEMLGEVLWERGVPVRLGVNGTPLQIGAQRRGSQALYGSEASCSDTQPHQRAFQRAATARHSFHGDIGDRRQLRIREGQDSHYENIMEHREITRRDSNDCSQQRQGSKRWKEHKYIQDGDRETRIRRTTSERRPKIRITRDGSEEEGPNRRVPQRSQSLSSNRHRSRHISHSAERDRTSLELGELQQVLLDEELARKLQEEEEKILGMNPQTSPQNSYPEGDFRVAQVAQDEEIARYMQKQEIKSKRRSRELDGPVSWREHRAMMSQHDQRTRERQVPRERLDSEGLPSPTEDYSPEDQPHSPVSTLPTPHSIRNIAEELDPTFQSQRLGTDSLRAAQTGSTCPPLPAPQSVLLEEPTFIPPTKRQVDKSVRPKSKEKRENCKQQ